MNDLTKNFLQEIYPHLPNKYSDFIIGLNNYYRKQKTSFNYCRDLKLLRDNPEFIGYYLRVLAAKNQIRCILSSNDLMVLVNNVYNKGYWEVSEEVNNLVADTLYTRMMENLQRMFGESSPYWKAIQNVFVIGEFFKLPGKKDIECERGMLTRMTFDTISVESSSLLFNLVDSKQRVVGTIHLTSDNFQITIGRRKPQNISPEDFFSMIGYDINDVESSENQIPKDKNILIKELIKFSDNYTLTDYLGGLEDYEIPYQSGGELFDSGKVKEIKRVVRMYLNVLIWKYFESNHTDFDSYDGMTIIDEYFKSLGLTDSDYGIAKILPELYKYFKSIY